MKTPKEMVALIREYCDGFQLSEEESATLLTEWRDEAVRAESKQVYSAWVKEVGELRCKLDEVEMKREEAIKDLKTVTMDEAIDDTTLLILADRRATVERCKTSIWGASIGFIGTADWRVICAALEAVLEETE